MVQRLFLNWVDAESAGASISGQDNLILLTRAHKAQALLAFLELTKTRAHIALNAPILKSVPIAGRHRHPKLFRSDTHRYPSLRRNAYGRRSRPDHCFALMHPMSSLIRTWRAKLLA